MAPIMPSVNQTQGKGFRRSGMHRVLAQIEVPNATTSTVAPYAQPQSIDGLLKHNYHFASVHALSTPLGQEVSDYHIVRKIGSAICRKK
jgi:hypothetical protein